MLKLLFIFLSIKIASVKTQFSFTSNTTTFFMLWSLLSVDLLYRTLYVAAEITLF